MKALAKRRIVFDKSRDFPHCARENRLRFAAVGWWRKSLLQKSALMHDPTGLPVRPGGDYWNADLRIRARQHGRAGVGSSACPIARGRVRAHLLRERERSRRRPTPIETIAEGAEAGRRGDRLCPRSPDAGRSVQDFKHPERDHVARRGLPLACRAVARRAAGESQSAIARSYDVSCSTISRLEQDRASYQ